MADLGWCPTCDQQLEADWDLDNLILDDNEEEEEAKPAPEEPAYHPAPPFRPPPHLKAKFNAQYKPKAGVNAHHHSAAAIRRNHSSKQLPARTKAHPPALSRHQSESSAKTAAHHSRKNSQSSDKLDKAAAQPAWKGIYCSQRCMDLDQEQSDRSLASFKAMQSNSSSILPAKHARMPSWHAGSKTVDPQYNQAAPTYTVDNAPRSLTARSCGDLEP